MTGKLKAHLEWELEAYRKFNDQRALKYKTWFFENSTTFTEVDERLSKEIADRNQCRVKQCYHNVWISLSSRPDFRYFEGYEMSKGIPIPIEHSWIVTANGKVVDPTMILNGTTLQKQMKTDYKIIAEVNNESRLPLEYFGMELPKEFVLKMGIKTQRSGSYLLDYFQEMNLPKIERKTK